MNTQKVITIGKAVIRIAAALSVARVTANAVRMVVPTTTTKFEKIVVEIGASLITAAITDAVVDKFMETVDEVIEPLENKEQEPQPLEA